MPDNLEILLIGAIEAPPDQRAAYEEPLARHGAAAVVRLLPWVGHPDLAEFAIEAIVRAAELGATESATRALDLLLVTGHPTASKELLTRALRRVQSLPAEPPTSEQKGPLVRLERGRRYRRRALHSAGLGGNPQKGISYPAKGNHVLLFSGGPNREGYGYADGWESPDIHRYFGEWAGPGPMVLEWGNRAIVERSPNLYLFTAAPPHCVFEGRFEHLDHSFEPTHRQGVPLRAIVFRLRRIADVVPL